MSFLKRVRYNYSRLGVIKKLGVGCFSVWFFICFCCTAAGAITPSAEQSDSVASTHLNEPTVTPQAETVATAIATVTARPLRVALVANPTEQPIIIEESSTPIPPTSTPIPTETATPTATSTPTNSPTATNSSTPTMTATPSPTMTSSPTKTPKPTSTPHPQLRITTATANCRSGPGTNYSVVSSLALNQTVSVIARNQSSSWYLVRLPSGSLAWISSIVVEPVFAPSVNQVAIAATIPPSPVPTATPIPPTAAPAQPTATISIIPSGSTSVCSCSSNQYNCSDFNTHNSAQACFNYCMQTVGYDVHRLDADNDNLACESLP